MKRFERIAAGAIFAIGAGAAYAAIEMGYGLARFPGSGFLPFWIAALLALTAGLYLVANRGRDANPRRLWEPAAWRRPCLSALVMLAFTLLMGWLGFFAATFLLFVAWLVVVENAKWLTVGTVSLLGTLGAYILFAMLLKVPLPKGLFF
jgi:hypothetical protein